MNWETESRKVVGKTLTTGDGDEVVIRCGQYGNGRLAIFTEMSDTGEPFDKLTVNLAGEELGDDEFFVAAWHEPITGAARRSGLFVDTGRRVPTGFVEAEVWRLA